MIKILIQSENVKRYLLTKPPPPIQNHPTYKGSHYSVTVRWKSDEITSESIKIMSVDDILSCAQYALDSNLLTADSWKRFRDIAKNQKKKNG